MMSKIIGPLIALVTVAAFGWLAWYSLHTKPADANAFHIAKLREYERDKAVRDRKTIMDIFNISEEETAKPVVLWK